VEHVLQSHFGYLLVWLKETERNVEKGRYCIIRCFGSRSEMGSLLFYIGTTRT
jgi:hypothetical protein